MDEMRANIIDAVANIIEAIANNWVTYAVFLVRTQTREG
jgi:hypothetical protein